MAENPDSLQMFPSCKCAPTDTLFFKDVRVGSVKTASELLPKFGKPDSIKKNFSVGEERNLMQYWYGNSYFALDKSGKSIISYKIRSNKYELCPLGIRVGQTYETYSQLLPSHLKASAMEKLSNEKISGFTCSIHMEDIWGVIYITFGKSGKIEQYSFYPYPDT
jgi:hypothetical protein